MQLQRGQAWPARATKSVPFTGAANLGATGTTTTYFTVTGEVLIEKIVPFCTVDLTESGAVSQVSLGVTGSVSLFIGVTDTDLIDANEFWVDATPDANGIALPAALKDIVITDNILVDCTGAVSNVNGGALRIDVWWRPLSDNGNLVAA